MLFVSGPYPLLECLIQLLLAIQLSGKAHKDSDYIRLVFRSQTHPGGDVLSGVIIFVFVLAATGHPTQTA